jgi:hypothetical protein
MTTQIVISPQHPMFLLEGGGKGIDVPIPENLEQLVYATPTCWIVICAADVDGDTEVTFGSFEEVDPGEPPIHDGVLETPLFKLVLGLASGEDPLVLAVPTERTRLRIWTNDPQFPNKVTIAVG